MKIVIDLENTLSNAKHRMHLMGKPEFQEAFSEDGLNENVKHFMDALRKDGFEIIILTAKHIKHEKIVVDWLENHNIYYNDLVMKKSDIDDLEFKAQYANNYKNDILMALDDVGSICEMFGRHGIPCLRIEQK